jgi:hypothetical protein
MFSRRKGSDEPINDKNKWLQRLQQESWELELLVSGFSILLLYKAIGFLTDKTEEIDLFLNSSLPSSTMVSIFMNILVLSLGALIINLTLHLLMRGFWVGIVGLGSVAPKTDFDKLKYSSFFTEKLKLRVGNLDKLVVFLDNISSLVFAFAFLIIFMLLALAIYMVFLLAVLGGANMLIQYMSGGLADVFSIFASGILILIIITGLIYLFDFLSLGLIKKSKRLSRIYYPIYVFYGWITLAFLYRVIYYNLMSRYSRRRIALVLGGYLLLLMLVPSLYMDHGIYFDDNDDKYFISANYYDNLRNRTDVIEKVSIPSKITSETFLPLFIRYNPEYNSTIKKRFPDFNPSKTQELKSDLKFEVGFGNLHIGYGYRDKEKDPETALKCLSDFYNIYLDDSLITNAPVYFSEHPNRGEIGIEAMLDIATLQRGKHTVEVKLEYLKDSGLLEKSYAIVLFWKE